VIFQGLKAFLQTAKAECAKIEAYRYMLDKGISSLELIHIASRSSLGLSVKKQSTPYFNDRKRRRIRDLLYQIKNAGTNMKSSFHCVIFTLYLDALVNGTQIPTGEVHFILHYKYKYCN
jgi:hypothetical protein